SLARGRFESDGVEELLSQPVERTIEMVLRLEAQARGSSPSIQSASCVYSEVFEEKGIVTSDGAKAWTRLVRPEFRGSAVGGKDGQIQRGIETVGATGGWDCLFRRASPEAMADKAAARAVDLLSAGYPEGGRVRVLLSPALVGILTHEAVGHTVEADFVQAGSGAAGKLGPRVAAGRGAPAGSGAGGPAPGAAAPPPGGDRGGLPPEGARGAGGTLAVDDEGVLAQKTTIIREGVLASYLHDRESAARFGVAPTGNARAWEYEHAPLIRMRNTYIEPGDASLDEMIASMD